MTDDRGQREDLVCAGFVLAFDFDLLPTRSFFLGFVAKSKTRKEKPENRERRTREQREYETSRCTWEKKAGFCEKSWTGSLQTGLHLL